MSAAPAAPPPGRPAPPPGPDEAALLAQVNAGPPADLWARYRSLVEARRAGTLSAADHPELTRLSDAVEAHHAGRVAALAELAALRRVPLAALADALGFGPVE